MGKFGKWTHGITKWGKKAVKDVAKETSHVITKDVPRVAKKGLQIAEKAGKGVLKAGEAIIDKAESFYYTNLLIFGGVALAALYILSEHPAAIEAGGKVIAASAK